MGIRMGGTSMQKFMTGVAAVLVCSAFAYSVDSASAGWGGARGGHFHGFRGFYRGLYPYSLFGYPNYSYGGYYPYSLYNDAEPDCDFVWVNRTVKHKIVRRGIWTCR
jgi:hypothetical protein